MTLSGPTCRYSSLERGRSPVFTQVFKVARLSDRLLDEYPVFMRGELLLGWSPSMGQWCLERLGLKRRVSQLQNYRAGDFVVRRVHPMPRESGYALSIEKTMPTPGATERLLFDITTGKRR